MYTFGFTFRPWYQTKVLADGPASRRYVEDTAAEYGVDDRTRGPWKVRNDYLRDAPMLRRGPIDDDVIRFDTGRPAQEPATAGSRTAV